MTNETAAAQVMLDKISMYPTEEAALRDIKQYMMRMLDNNEQHANQLWSDFIYKLRCKMDGCYRDKGGDRC